MSKTKSSKNPPKETIQLQIEGAVYIVTKRGKKTVEKKQISNKLILEVIAHSIRDAVFSDMKRKDESRHLDELSIPGI